MPNAIWTDKKTSRGISLTLAFFAFALLFLLVYQLIVEPVGSKPAPNWSLVLAAGLFLLMAINFRHITTTLSPDGIKVNYGIFSCFRSWSQIESCEADKENRYLLSWGIRITKYQGKFTWVFNTMRGQKIAFCVKTAGPWNLIVTACDPKTMLEKAGEYLASER